MRLSDILTPATNIASNCEILSITSDSREVVPGSVFFCISGAQVDARIFVKDAFKNGAVAVVHEGDLLDVTGGLTVQVPDIRRALSYAASRYFAEPSKKLTNIAITGTSGKTSVAWILSHALQLLGSPTFIGGTLGYKLLGKAGPEAAKGIKELGNTTIDPISVHRFLSEALKNGARTAVFEATSQGVVQSRMRDVAWDGAIFTNLSRDHLDLHGTMERYEAAKRELFLEDLANSSKRERFAIFNFDDQAGERIGLELRAKNIGIRAVSFSTNADKMPDFLLANLKAKAEGLSFTLIGRTKSIEISSPLIGSHNAQNITCAALALESLGYGADRISEVVAAVPPVPGRLEPLHKKGISVYVDYAHKPDALEKVLEFLRPLCHGRLIVVFGCGGDRDKGKRSIMGEIASRLADVTVVTSDNPRTEDPQAIIEQILSGTKKVSDKILLTEPDRRKAILQAIQLARAGDIVLIAGKGHEPYQEVHGVKHPFHDLEVAREVLASQAS